ncbi:MAG TPA: ABC transporter ATP-binding protein, partial [Rubricoccaceae bacterium]|nr:ABC transporter ATP-binding protein [Rubricoccaceae bacterium]
MASPLRRVTPYFWRYRRLMLPGLACALASSIFALFVPGVVREAVDAVPVMVERYHAAAGTPEAPALYRAFAWEMVEAGLLIVALSVASGVFTFLMRQTVVVASRHIEYDLRNRLYEHLQTLSGGFYKRYATGDLLTRATSDIERVRRYIGPAFMYAARAVTAIVTALFVMVLISPTLTLWSLLPMPALAVAIFFVSKLVHERTDRQQQQYSALTSRVQEALAGIRVIKAYAQEPAWGDRFDRESERYRDRALDLARVDAAFRPIMLMLIGASSVLVVWIGGRQVIAGQLSLGNIAEFLIYVSILTWPVASFGYVISLIQQAAASMARITAVLDTPADVTDGPETDASIKTIEGRITFEDVTLRFAPDGPAVLDGVSFDVRAGSTVGIVGRTGSGKSTLVELVPRLMDPTEGRVFIDGRDVRTIPLQTLRRHIGVVPQDVFLFSDSVGNNVAFGEMEATEEAIRQAADEADLLANVEDFPERFETLVGERGITLSG